MSRFLLVCLGGAVGTGARYLLSGWILAVAGTRFPWGTLMVNVLGSFLLGVVAEIGVTTAAIPPTLRVAIATGALGGFTTYSTFNYETLQSMQAGAFGAAVANILATVAGCLLAGLAGVALVRWLMA
ncbi:MAG TPA: fluoride efflux transporter CrcB [Thermoanaerobaculia bacterium]|jgi:CrcB protein